MILDEHLELLLLFESLKPKIVSKETILSPLKKYFKTQNKIIATKQIAKNLNKYTMSKYISQRYYSYLSEIVNLIIEKRNPDIIKNRLNEILLKYK